MTHCSVNSSGDGERSEERVNMAIRQHQATTWQPYRTYKHHTNKKTCRIKDSSKYKSICQANSLPAATIASSMTLAILVNLERFNVNYGAQIRILPLTKCIFQSPLAQMRKYRESILSQKKILKVNIWSLLGNGRRRN